MLVDLITNSSLLEDLMLSEYPHLIVKGQHRREKEDGEILFVFRNLVQEQLEGYLNYKEVELTPRCGYEVRDSKTGEYLLLRVKGKVIRGSERIDEYLNRTIGHLEAEKKFREGF